MAVKKQVDRSVEKFIDKGADVKSNKKDKEAKSILVRFPMSMLNELAERKKKKPWFNRTQFIVDAVDDWLNKKSE